MKRILNKIFSLPLFKIPKMSIGLYQLELNAEKDAKLGEKGGEGK